jgi:tetratricopeptide (TPR) repeat protein
MTKSSSSGGSVNNIELGVQLRYLQEFINENGGVETFRGKSTADVCNKIVVPMTIQTKQSLCIQLQNDNSNRVGKPTWFISHAWQYAFLDVVEAITLCFKNIYGENKDEVVIWFDLFSNSQHDTTLKPFEWWESTFLTTIKNIGNVMMILLPWDNPITLTRAWCVFELFACQRSNSRFEVAMTEFESKRFLRMMGRNEGTFYDMLGRLKSENCISNVPSDKENIFNAIGKLSGGFAEIDSILFRVLEKWMISAIQKKVNETIENKQSYSFWQQALALLHIRQGKYDIAEVLLRDCIDINKVALGLDHPSTLASMNDLAALYCRQEHYSLAEPLYQSCKDIRLDSLGPTHPDTLDSISNLAGLFVGQKKFDKAESLYLTSAKTKELVLGSEHKSTVESLNNLAGLYCSQGKYHLAEPLLQRCLDIRIKLLGSDHPDTLTSINNFGAYFLRLKRYKEAEQLFSDCFEKRKRVLGINHPITIVSATNLAGVLCRMRKYEESESHYIFCVTNTTRSLGVSHPDTISAIEKLRKFYIKIGKEGKIDTLSNNCALNRTETITASNKYQLHSKTKISRQNFQCPSTSDEPSAQFEFKPLSYVDLPRARLWPWSKLQNLSVKSIKDSKAEMHKSNGQNFSTSRKSDSFCEASDDSVVSSNVCIIS